MCSELVISFCVSLLTFRSPLHHLEPQSGSYWEDNKSSEIRQNLGAANSQSARQGESPQKIIHLKLSQFIPETGVGPRSSAEHQQEILSSCRDFVSEPPQLWRGQRQGVFKWVNSRFSFIRNIKTLITGLKNGHQRVPCNLLPSRKQVVPTALHITFQTTLLLWPGSFHPSFSNAWNLLECLQLSDSLPWPFQCSGSFCLTGQGSSTPQRAET